MDRSMSMRAFATVALLLLAPLPGGADDARMVNDIKSWLRGYEPAFNDKDLGRLAHFYHPDVTIYEGGSINRGWADYRDHHLGPELEEMQQPKLSRSNVAVHLLDAAGRSAYVTSEYRLQTRIKERDIDAGGLETLIVVRGAEGAWKIRHSHTSSRRRPPSASPAAPGAAPH